MLNTAAWTVGAAKALYEFTMRQRAEYGGGRVFYSSRSDWGEGPRERALEWMAGELVQVTGTPSDRELTPIPAGEMAGAVDPAFPWLDTLARLDRGEDCDATYRVFDGVRRMNITMVPLGTNVLTDDRGWTYEGLARACGIKFARDWRLPGGWRVGHHRRRDQPRDLVRRARRGMGPRCGCSWNGRSAP